MPSSAVMTFTDPFEFQQSFIGGRLVEAIVTGSGEYRASLTKIDLRRVWMQRAWTSLPFIFHTALLNDRSYIFFSADAKHKPPQYRGMELLFGDILVYSAGSEYYRRSFSEFRWGSMSLPSDDLAVAGRALVGRDLVSPAASQRIRPPPHIMSRLLRLHDAAGHLAATAPEILAHPEVAKALEHELVQAMVACVAIQMSEEPRRMRWPVMQRFERVLEANKGKPLYLAEVCAAVGVSVRTLRSHCQEHLGMSPHQYLWLRRMNLVRRALVRGDPNSATVTAIALDHGFGELGRFAVAYRKLFGEAPSMTLQRPADDRGNTLDSRFSTSKLPILP